MDTKLQLVEKLQAATNILVTVSNSPTVDQLAACIGMTLWLNKADKHATAVFSGDIPNTLEFLQPEATIEKNTDSLRDFIIALDKSKADKLRYKVEDRVVKIFITPYRTSLSADDLEFSQGDFNVDAIVAIGVTKQEELDQAIVAHGRILHDAVVTTINTGNDGDLGSVNWHDTSASSLSELAYELCQSIDAKQLDPQIATALLTGIVAETARFSNDKTTPNTMSVAAALMGAGANQQLVANKLEEAKGSEVKVPKTETKDSAKSATDVKNGEGKSADGTLEIEHGDSERAEIKAEEALEEELAKQKKEEAKQKPEEDQLDKLVLEELKPENTPEEEIKDVKVQPEGPGFAETEDKPHKGKLKQDNKIITEPPKMGGMLTANSRPDDMPEPVTDPLSLPAVDSNQLLTRPSEPEPNPNPPMEAKTLIEPPNRDEKPQSIPSIPTIQPPAGPGPESTEQEDKQTLSEIEKAVESPHLDELRDQVSDALGSAPAKSDEAEQSPLAFNPKDFTIDDQEEEPGSPPQYPPPIVPPNFLPPEPPATE